MRAARVKLMVTVLAAGVSAWGPVGSVAAEKFKLKDGQEFTGKLLGRDGEHIAVVLPRSGVASIDGKPLPPPIVQGSPAPDFQVTDLAGAAHKLSSYQGQVTLLQFWATWCPHCRSDLNLLKDLHERYGKQGLQVLAVSIDEDVNKLRSFVTEQRLAYPVIAARAQASGPSLSELYETGGVPAYFLIDPRGIVVNTFSGSAAEGRIDLENQVKALLPPPRAATVPGADRQS